VGTIADFFAGDKAAGLTERVRDLLTVAIIILVGVVSFGLGKLSEREGGSGSVDAGAAVRVEQPAAASSVLVGEQEQEAERAPEEGPFPEGRFVASRNSDVFHLPWCPGAARISEANEVWFETREQAEAAGLRPAANCKGLE
jgi:hypothetical protein